MGHSGSSIFCDVGAVAGSHVVANDQRKAKEAIHNNIIGNIDIGTISSNAPMPNTPIINPIEPHLRVPHHNCALFSANQK